MNTSERSLHDYFRSSAAYRVRIALHLKGLDFRHVGVHLLRGGGEQLSPGYRRVNPQALLPTLQEGDFTLAQSLAILEYLDERYPAVPLLPVDIELRAVARQIALMIACDIHPLNNLRVLKFLATTYKVDDAGKQAWITHWISLGFRALEELLASRAGASSFCVGDSPSIADCCLVPQVFNAQRFGIDMASYPRIEAIASSCAELDAFRRAHPACQPDSE